MQIALSFYKPEFEEELSSFLLPDDQAQFTGMPSDMLENSRKDQSKTPVVLTAGEMPVGFFLLESSARIFDYSSNPFSMLLAAFSVNYQHQGKGYAKKGLLLLPSFMAAHFPECTAIVLGVNKRNIRAYQLYLKAGFIDEGKIKMGPLGEQHILSLALT
nr:GNAT family N-acetyltransferase [Metabacillus kandeliae]